FGDLTRITFWHLFERHLKPGGLYAIEDWGTGYYGDWPDGRTYQPKSAWRVRLDGWLQQLGLLRRVPVHSHSYGMVAFVKELVDERGAHDLTCGHLKGKPTRASRFASLTIVPSIVFVRKPADEMRSAA